MPAKKPITLRGPAGFEALTCPRCGGSGHYSFNLMTGTKCFKCHGAKLIDSARGAKARKFYRDSLKRRAGDIKTGDFVQEYQGINGPLRWWQVKVRPYNPESKLIEIDLLRRGAVSQSLRTGPDHLLTCVTDEPERLAKLASALAYQDTL